MAEPISIRPTPELERALAGRTSPLKGFRNRSSMVSAMADRYHEICRRQAPRLKLAEWLLIFDSLNGCWMIDGAARSAAALAHEVHDACTLNEYGDKWQVPDWPALVERLAALDFAAQIAVVDAAERFVTLGVRPADAEPTDADPWAPWRAPVRAIVGPMADD